MRLLICFALVALTAGTVYLAQAIAGQMSDDMVTGFLLGAVVSGAWFAFIGILDHKMRQRGL